METSRGRRRRRLRPLVGDIVNCDMCKQVYTYYIWCFGSDKCLCRKCVRKRPSAFLDNFDLVDIAAEERLVYDEIEEQEIREGKERARTPEQKKVKYPDYRKEWRGIQKKTIAKFKGREGQ